MLGSLSRLRGHSFNKGSTRLLDDTLDRLSESLWKLVSTAGAEGVTKRSKDFCDVSGLNELSISSADAELLLENQDDSNAELFKNILSRPNYAPRLEPLLTLSDIIGSGFEDISESDKANWLSATSAIFPLSAFHAYSNLAGEVPLESTLPSETVTILRKLIPALLYVIAKDQLSLIRTRKPDQDKERVARLEEGLRTMSPSFRDLAFSKTRRDLNLTGVKNLYSRTFGEVFATAVVTVPSNQAPSMTYGVEKRAQLLFVLEYCARNLGNALRILEEYQILSGRSSLADKPMIPNPSVFLAILRREMSRLKDIEKAVAESENKLHNQAFIYFTEAGRPLSRLPLKTRPQMVRFLKGFKRRIDEAHSSFRVEEIPGALRDELVQFLTVAK